MTLHGPVPTKTTIDLAFRVVELVNRLDQLTKPRPMSAAQVPIGGLLRIRSRHHGWVVCRFIEHVGYIVATSDVDAIIRDGIGWLPLFPDDNKEGE